MASGTFLVISRCAVRRLIFEDKFSVGGDMMRNIGVVVLAVLLVFSMYYPCVGTVSAAEEVEAREETAQEEEQMDDETLRQLLYEEREMQDDPSQEEQAPEDEKGHADDTGQDDRGDK